MKYLAFLKHILAINIKASAARRGAFLLQMGFMILNNLIFFTIWWFFFDSFEEVGGWRLPEVTVMYGFVAFCFGAGVILFGGTRDFAQVIVDGDLDSYLVQPKHPLVQVVFSQSVAAGWGDIVSGIFLYSISGYASIANTLLLLFALVAVIAIITSTRIIFHCTAFWLGPVNAVARTFVDFLLIFSVYPQSIFHGPIKVLFFTLIPAGFVGYIPVELVRSFDWWLALALVGGAIAYVGVALLLFHAGLKRYESGNRIGLRVN